MFSDLSFYWWCKTQNSGLRSKEEKPRWPNKPAQQMQHARGFIVGCANGWLWSPGRQSTPNSKLGKLFIDKKSILSAYYIQVTKWLVTCLQSNPIGTNFAGYMFTKQFYWYNFAGFCSNLKQFYWYKRRGLLFKLRRPRASQLSRGLLLGADCLAGSRSPDGGGESHHFTETETQVPAACQPQPRQPHIIKLISKLQNPTRRISDTWIIDTDKRETRYQPVKVHQTIRRPHNVTRKQNWLLLVNFRIFLKKGRK